MEFNPSKCQVLHISRARQQIHSQYTLLGEILESVGCVRYLGVSITKDLCWNTLILIKLQVKLIVLEALFKEMSEQQISPLKN